MALPISFSLPAKCSHTASAGNALSPAKRASFGWTCMLIGFSNDSRFSRDDDSVVEIEHDVRRVGLPALPGAGKDDRRRRGVLDADHAQPQRAEVRNAAFNLVQHP